MRLLLLLLVTKLVAGQLGQYNEVEVVQGMANMPQITSLDVQCEKSGMTVNVEFSLPFDGVIFSKGHFSNPACRYVEPDTGQRSYTFAVPMDGCGTAASDDDDTIVSNVVIFQMDSTVQELWDTAKKLSCVWTNKYNKAVNFEPLQVSMLEVVQTRFEGDDIKCWMDIQRGTYPHTKPMDGILRIGEPLTVMVYLKDTERRLDVAVRDCWAYGEPEFEDPATPSLQMTSSNGCPTRMKLMHFWARTYDTFDTGATLITYTNMSAFKFPDRMQVFLTCNVQICTEHCEDRCIGEPSEPVTFVTTHDIIKVTTPLTPIRLPPPPPPYCRPGSKDPRCRPSITKPICGPGSTDPECRRPLSPACYPGSRDPACKPTTVRPPAPPPLVTQKPICYPGSRDPSCPKPTPPTRRPFTCRPGSKDPRCPQPTTSRPSTPSCYPGSPDPRCPKPTTPFTCRPGSKDPRCPQPTTPRPSTPSCYPGITGSTMS
ncbi:uncharacterized protein LOC121866368 isoform X2 [Homarus americanus]|uniref:uncharacterized protein LOC121866368 isoform X2 n=1 Tax=Homarus americanus TaxID=6706 RepID=UPI001C46518D|nr:uncharacterized protein LOC121866368 isoform X2 [Homarus americanus]